MKRKEEKKGDTIRYDTSKILSAASSAAPLDSTYAQTKSKRGVLRVNRMQAIVTH